MSRVAGNDGVNHNTGKPFDICKYCVLRKLAKRKGHVMNGSSSSTLNEASHVSHVSHANRSAPYECPL